MDFTAAPTICLAMIVRDEAHILPRCLASVKPYIDHWIICDTGSVDETCAVAQRELGDLPGRIVHHSWRDFGHNRSLALAEARATGCDYTLVMDADEVLRVDDPRALQSLSAGAYRLQMHFPTLAYPSVRLLRSSLNWRYVGVIHEYPWCEPPAEEYLLQGLHLWTDGDGARGRSGTKAARDLDVLREAVTDEPSNPRYWFYLAQAFEVAGDIPAAASAYARRVGMGDYLEEVWYSHYRMGQLAELREDWPAAVLHYIDAYNTMPSRAESLYRLAFGYHMRHHDHMAMLLLEQVALIAKPVGALFVEEAIYEYLRWVHYCACLYNTGQKDEAIAMARRVLAAGKTPPQFHGALKKIIAQDPQVQDQLAAEAAV